MEIALASVCVTGIFLGSILLLASCTPSSVNFSALRKEMVEEQIRARGIKDERVLSAMEKVPRHKFVPEAYRSSSYEDRPLPIGEGQTISQPYIVALMTELLGLNGKEKVLELGTGSGYQAAVLAEIVKEVYSVEIVQSLSQKAGAVLKELGYTNIRLKVGDGYNGWKENAPYDAIIVTFAADEIPPPLLDQLKEGGKIVIPVGEEGMTQSLILGEKRRGKLEKRKITDVLFVPMQRIH